MMTAAVPGKFLLLLTKDIQKEKITRCVYAVPDMWKATRRVDENSSGMMPDEYLFVTSDQGLRMGFWLVCCSCTCKEQIAIPTAFKDISVVEATHVSLVLVVKLWKIKAMF